MPINLRAEADRALLAAEQTRLSALATGTIFSREHSPIRQIWIQFFRRR